MFLTAPPPKGGTQATAQPNQSCPWPSLLKWLTLRLVLCMSSSLAPFVFFAGWFFERWSPQPRIVTAPCECFCDCEGTCRAGLYFYLLVGAFCALVLDRVFRKIVRQVRSIATQPPRRRPDLADAARSYRALYA